jgi:hypothetical protein
MIRSARRGHQWPDQARRNHGHRNGRRAFRARAYSRTRSGYADGRTGLGLAAGPRSGGGRAQPHRRSARAGALLARRPGAHVRSLTGDRARSYCSNWNSPAASSVTAAGWSRSCKRCSVSRKLMQILGFETHHLQKVFEDLQAGLPRDRGEVSRQTGDVICHVRASRRQVGSRWIGHCAGGTLLWYSPLEWYLRSH